MQRCFSIRLRRVSRRRGDAVENLCEAVGIVAGRDTDKTVIQIFRTMLAHSGGDGIGGSELAQLSGVNRITCLHHLKRLEEAGIVQRENRKYCLRHQRMRAIMKELRKEALMMFDMIDGIANEIDEQVQGD